MTYTANQIVTHACVDAGISKSELAARLGMSRQALYKRLETGKLSVQEWQAIAMALGGRLQLQIVYDENRL